MRVTIRILLLGTLCALCLFGGLLYVVDVFLDPKMISQSTVARLQLAATGIFGLVAMAGGAFLAMLGLLASKLENDGIWKRVSRRCAVVGALAGVSFFFVRQAFALFA